MSNYIDTGADITSNRHKGNAASRDAFERNLFTQDTDLELVYAYICASPTGLTSKETAYLMGKPLNAISGRLTQLEKAGRIRGTGARREGAEVHVVTGMVA